MRDALSLMDQILASCGPNPTDEAVADAMGAIDRTMVQEFAEALVRKDARKVLARVEEVFNRGLDLKRLAEELALQLRHLFVTKAVGEAPSELAESEQKALVALAQEADSAQLARLFDIVHGCVWDVSRAAQPRLALEMALLKAIQLSPASSIPELLAKVERLAQGLNGGDGAAKSQSGAQGGRSGSANFRV
jgi:DNA polymerase-3 subunit gamma/tau